MAYPLTQTGFILVTFFFYGWTALVANKGMNSAGFSAKRKNKIFFLMMAGLTGWILFISLFAFLGFFADFSTVPPRMAIVFLIPLTAVLLITFSKTLREIIVHVHPKEIIRIQVFRVFVEILLWALWLQHLVPVQMTLAGRNLDILTGLTAPLVAWYCARKRWSSAALLLWNCAGLLLLLNIMVIAILSMPAPFRVFMNEPSNTIVTTFPFIWLPGLLVPLAYALHFFSIRQVRLLKRNTP